MPNYLPELQAALARCQEAAKAFEGYHQFEDVGGNESTGPVVRHGSFEVFQRVPGRGDNLTKGEWSLQPGWYWWPCFPGCLPDGEPNGPFPTAEGAYLDAIGE